MKEFNYKKTIFGIRNRILVFALIVTLIPSLGLGWAFYTQTKKMLQEKVELENKLTQAREGKEQLAKQLKDAEDKVSAVDGKIRIELDEVKSEKASLAKRKEELENDLNAAQDSLKKAQIGKFP